MTERRARFEVRRVDQARRVFTYVDSADKYHDACLIADIACEETNDHHVIYDALEDRVLYDSRKLA